MTKRLGLCIESSSKAVQARHREYGASLGVADSELDAYVDSLEDMRRTRLEQCRLFDCALVRRLSDQPVGEFDYSEALDDAKLASRICTLLYSDEVKYTRLAYEEQAEHMGTLTALIEEDGSADAIDELIGPKLGAALRDGHRLYDEMIEARAVRSRGSEVDLRTINQDLSRSILNYVIALFATLRDEDPVSDRAVRRCLRPIDALREQILAARNRNAGQVAESSDPAALEELVSEQQAVDAELGLVAEESDDQAPSDA